MGYFSKLLKDTKIGKFLKEVGITIGEKKRDEKHEEKRKIKKKKHNCDFSDNEDDNNWIY
jgi:hypothetical protein